MRCTQVVQGRESSEHMDEQVLLNQMVATQLEVESVHEFVSERFDRLSVGKKETIYK